MKFSLQTPIDWWKIMKLTFSQLLIVLILTGVSYANAGRAQSVLTQSVEISVDNQSLSSVLKKLAKDEKVKFVYSRNVVETDKKVSINARGEKLEEVLDKLLKANGITYEVINERIVLSKNLVSSDSGTPLAGIISIDIQAIVKGKVTDEKGIPLPGVSVNVKGTNTSTSTDANGNYSISTNDGILVFTYIGYKTQEVAVGNSTTINVTLVSESTSLTEVLVVGYGTQSRKTVTDAISRVKGKDLTDLPVPDPRQAIQGRVPGVVVTNNGSPGASPIVRIRGIGSIQYASDPLYVIDGFPEADLSMIDSRDIQSIDILRDASSSAIYGSRGANGVVIVTTKKPNKSDKLRVNFDSYYGNQTAWKQLDLLNTEEYIKYGTMLKQNAGAALPARFSKLDDPIYAGATQTYRQSNTDWQKEMFRTAPISQTNLSLATAGENSRFYASGGYFKQDGIMSGTNYDRYNFRVNSDHSIGKIFTFGQTLTLVTENILSENNAGGRTQLKHTIQNVPYIPVKDPTLSGGYRGPSGDDGSDPQNPVRVALQDLSRTGNVKILGTAFAEAKIWNALSYRLTGGINYLNNLTRNNQPIYNESFNARALNRVEQSQNYNRNIYLSNQLDFEKTIEEHHFKATGVFERQSGRNRNLFGGGNYTTNELREVTSSLSDLGLSGGLGERELLSYLGRLNYDYKDKYILKASIRRDGNSIWAPGHKWQNFPSISAGWRISEEPFMQGFKNLSELKIRGSWGKLGFNSGALGNYPWQATLQQNTAAIFGDSRATGAYFNSISNEDLFWEFTKMTNVGVDLGFWNNALTIQAEYYVRRTEGLLLQVPLPGSIGFSVNPLLNTGSMDNKGFELQAGYSKQSGDFTWNVSGNISTLLNSVKSFGDKTSSPIYAGANGDYGNEAITRTALKESVQDFYGWKTDGLFQNVNEIIDANGKPVAAVQNLPFKEDKVTVDMAAYNDPSNKGKFTRPGDIKFKDINGDGVITADDRTKLGSFISDYTYGLNFNAGYKNFDLTLFFQGQQGNEIYNGTKVLTQGMLRLFGAGKEVLTAWTPTNTNTEIPRAVDGDPNGNARTSDRFVEDGSYLRLKNLMIGYDLKKGLLSNTSKSPFNSARIYVSAQNLLTLTKYTGYDPEIGSRFGAALTSGIDYGQFPQPRTFLFGIQVGF